MSPMLPWERARADLTIQCGGAFHPSHVTTRLCLQILDHCRASLEAAHVLDVGCGTGILTLAAARMGARLCAGADTCGRALATARINGSRNDLEQRVHWIRGSADSVRASFHWVLANLPFHVLWDLLDDLPRALSSPGRLLLSGFHDIDWHHLAVRLKGEGLTIQEIISGDLSFAAEPPSGSYTWMAVLAGRA
ncbi:MAG: 50S ribosomal protein L11 methyltransferase [Syntrophobacteraceae bacterium]|nr:50S ribosomal protein L11 methyltransferase [Syntrophobacteraceae bacterium]